MEKIQGKFYRLQHSEWLRACHELQPSELNVLYYIRTLDPYDKGVEISVSKIADDLSTPKKKVHKSTVSRALKALNEKGFIDLELVQVRVKITVGSMQSTLPTDNGVVSTQPKEPEDNTECGDTTTNASKQQSAPKTPAEKESQAPKIIKTYKDFKDSLSDEERESFLKFGEEMSKQLPKPPQLVTKWIAANWEEIKEKWLKSTNKPTEKQTNKWADHPNRSKWLKIINTRGTGIFVFENDDEYEERNQFLDWAVKENLVTYE